MDNTKRLITTIWDPVAGAEGQLQPHVLVETLLLFDQVVIESHRLRDIGELVRWFGPAAVAELLTDGSVQVLCDVATVGQTGQTVLARRPPDKLLPLNSFEFSTVYAGHRRDYVHGCMKEFAESSGLQGKPLIKLKERLARSLASYNRTEGNVAVGQLRKDLVDHHPGLRQAVAMGVQRTAGRTINPDQLRLKVEPLGETEFRVDSNLGELAGLDAPGIHKATENGLLASGGLNLRLEVVKQMRATPSVRTEELSLLDCRLAALIDRQSPVQDLKRLRRVLAITGFPDLGQCKPGDVSLERLIEVRQSDACETFRKWLQTGGELTDEEIEAEFRPVRDRLRRLVGGTPGKLVRWVTSTGVGLIPVVGTIASAGLGLVDAFILDRLIPRPGPLSFLGNELRSVFPADRR